MGGIIGVFNNEKSTELVIKGLEVLKKRGKFGFIIRNEKKEFYSDELQELKELTVLEKSKNCLGQCFYFPIEEKQLVSKGKCKFVADAEVYNREELKEKYEIDGENDYEVLLGLMEKVFPFTKENEKYIKETFSLKEKLYQKNWFDGVYAFAYWVDDELYIGRDIIGLKPVWYSHRDGFSFASEKKALETLGYPHAIELDPRVFLKHNLKENRLSFIRRDFFSVEPEIEESREKQKEKIKENLLYLLTESILWRIPKNGEKFGVLFSGGLDSTLIAYICKRLGVDFVCYTAVMEEPGLKPAEDLKYSREIAEKLGLKLKIKKVGLGEVEKYLKEIVPLIEDIDVAKVGVALPMYISCESAREDGIKTIFSGLGSEELFAGYERHRRVRKEELNKECLLGLLKMYERDTYRDEVVATSHGISLRTPFLSKELVDYALKIPPSLKVSRNENKLILRELARDLGLEEVANRKKRAAQYGSNFHKALEKLAKKKGYRHKKDYLREFYPSRDIKLGCLFSSGKDSAHALWIMLREGYPVECLIALKSQNPASYMFHTPAIEMVEKQAEAIGLPLVLKETKGEKEKELKDLKDALREAKESYGIKGVITGALWSNYQKERIQRVSLSENLKVFSPLWHINQETVMRLVVNNFEVIFTSISAYGLDKSWLGRRIEEEDVDRLVALDKRIGLNVAGEGGEFESLVLDGPMFKKKLVILNSEIDEEDENTARLVIKEVKFEDKF